MAGRGVRDAVQVDSFVTPGEVYRILAPSSSLREHLTDSYWCAAMEEVCGGKLEGVAVRYTGKNLVLMQFRPKRLSPAGYRYPLSLSIPAEYLVPVVRRQGTDTVSMAASFHSSLDAMENSNAGATHSRLCVVCGKYNVPGMVQRHHGLKCKECVGKKSNSKLRMECGRRKDEDDA